MKEIGFWDYTCPTHGSLERYHQSDWDALLDDMAEGGFNSLVLGIKWLTTGYRSRYPWLDQDPECTAINSDNALIHHALQGARRRNIRTWLLVVATIYPTRQFNLPYGVPYWGPEFTVYDLDCPGLGERMKMLFEEVVDLFGNETDGIVVELEFCDGEAPHRIPIYDEWAHKNNRPDFATIKNIRLEPRAYPYAHWRDFTTTRRIEVLRQIEAVVRARGFQGELTSIIELDNQPTAVLGNVNMEMLWLALPHWPVVTYDSIYDRRRNRLATMDFCVRQPQQLGLSAYYLTRGVMTFGIPPEMPPTGLEEQWRLSLEDAQIYRPDILWFMGSDARLDGAVCSNVKLPQWGFNDGRVARQRLMQLATEMGVHVERQ
ncbi:MAG: hypothetical protein M1546_06710 [Chloroflexi bacterium]|nr:hypothetical protein [Chloroflexota bacterium]